MSRLKNLYTYLITNRRAHLNEWAAEYEQAIRDVEIVRAALAAGKDLTAEDTYIGTSLAGPGAWRSFARRHLYEKSNGVASRGQSVLSEANFNAFIADGDFRCALAKLIQQPDKPTFQAFDAAWTSMCERLNAGRNPLLVNRVLAACTLQVSSTANVFNFMSLYGWLAKEGILTDALTDADWYDKNVHLISWLHQQFAEELTNKTTTPVILSIFVWELYANLANPFSLRKQVIRYGAPGTGKTFTARRDTKLLWQMWRERCGFFCPQLTVEECTELVQFHPSYGYEDFIEGLRPVLGQDRAPALKLQNGHFKEFCRRAGKWETDVYRLPGVGRTLAENWQAVTVGDLRPFFASQLNGISWDGIQDRPDSEKIVDIVPPFFFLIDEINRAELSRVLGELMLCLEYRGVGAAITTQYGALNKEDTGMLAQPTGYRFFIPHNVYVIGTMNTIDRSVESFDLALRRRFRWERIEPDIVALRYHLKSKDKASQRPGRDWSKLADDLERMNACIRSDELLGPDYEIGHAYLMNLCYADTLTCAEVRENVWDDAIRPLLEEYLRGSGRDKEIIPAFAKAFGL